MRQSVLEMHRSLRGAAGSFTDRWVLDHVFDRTAPTRWLCSRPSPLSCPIEIKAGASARASASARAYQLRIDRQTTHPALSEVLSHGEALVESQQEAAQHKRQRSHGDASGSRKYPGQGSFLGSVAAQRLGSRVQPRPVGAGERALGAVPPLKRPSDPRRGRHAASAGESAAAAARASARARAWARAGAAWAALRPDSTNQRGRREGNGVQHGHGGASTSRLPGSDAKWRSLADLIHPHRGRLTSAVPARGTGRHSAACVR